MKSVVLAGIKHCGKSTLGKLLARRWDLPFFDTDTEMEERFFAQNGRRLNCREIYREAGEETFRRLEAETVEVLVNTGKPGIFALGGGAVNNPFLPLDTVRKLGFAVWLDLKPELAYPRVLRRGLPPFLAGTDDPEAEFKRICAEREPAFRQFAQLRFRIESDRPAAQNVEELALMLEKGTTQ